MKYIRTKDGRVIDTTKIVTGSKYMDFATNDESFKKIFKTEPLAKADTIEELCDEFVVKHKSNKKPYVADGYQKHQILEDRQKVFEYDVEAVYGAIWTNQGLIYVAKMNSKGELELI